MGEPKTYVQRVQPFVAWQYTGQPESEWPEWFAFVYGRVETIPTKRMGHIAAAVTNFGEVDFWRWFDPETFERDFELAPADALSQEREACAKVADRIADQCSFARTRAMAEGVAAAIRARAGDE